MKMSQLFGRTLREHPSEAELISHKLLLQSGMIHQVSTGVYSYLPLAWRSLKKIEAIIRKELDAVGAQEIKLGMLQPKEIWEKSGRDNIYGNDMFRLKDRRGRNLALPPTNEELITETVKSFVQSYNDLPFILYQIQTKFRDEPRPRGGLIRVREFDMMDAYSFDTNENGLDINYNDITTAYVNAFVKCGIETVIVEADSGAIGGKDSKEFVLLADSGEDTILLCDNCEYAANDEKASFNKDITNQGCVTFNTFQEIHTPDIKKVSDVADFLNLNSADIIKTIAYIADDDFILVCLRGDLSINEVKLRNFLKCQELRLANDTELECNGLTSGYISPLGLTNIIIIADDSILINTNYCLGGNKKESHYVNANLNRDFYVTHQTDIALAENGYMCQYCNGTLNERRAIEIGHVFKLGTKYSESMGAYYNDGNGDSQPIVMGCYGIGIGRILAGALEQHSDENGIVFPKNIAPFQVIVISLNTDQSDVCELASDIYEKLNGIGIETIIDDRENSAGIKFNDADLFGIPIRIVVSSRNLKMNSVEIKIRTEKSGTLILIENIVDETLKSLGRSI
jgi:prolyl-tRNA synthetase